MELKFENVGFRHNCPVVGRKGGGGGGNPNETDGVLVVSLKDVNFGCLVSLRVFRAKRHFFKLSRSRLG